MDGDQYILSLNNIAKTWVLKYDNNTILNGRMSRDGTRLMGEIIQKGGMIADTGFRVVNTNGQGVHELTIATPSGWTRKTVHAKLQQLENNGKTTADKMAEDVVATNDFEIDDVNDKVTVKQEFFQRFTRPTHSDPVEQKKLRREKTKQLLRQMIGEFHGQMSGRKVVMNKEDIDLRHTFRKQKVRYAAVKEMVASGVDGKVLDLTADLESDEGFYVDIEDLNDAVTLKLDETNSMKIELTDLDTDNEDNNRYTVTRKEDGTETAETDQVPGTTYRLKQLEFVLGSASGETDTTAPVITLVGANPQTVEAGNLTYSELGANATDNYDGDLTSSIVIDDSAVDTSAVGSYTVTYNVTDAAGNDAIELERTVNVVDTIIPVITLVGANPQTVEAGQTYNELGATATDNHDDDTNLTNSIAIDATAVDTSAVGDYTVTYNVTDAAGNVANEVTRTVRVVDTTKPVITRIGGHVINLEVTPENNNSYTDHGATVTDNHDFQFNCHYNSNRYGWK